MRLKRMKEQKDLPPGDTFQCRACGARIRRGEPHTAVSPFPHNTLEALFVEVDVIEDDASTFFEIGSRNVLECGQHIQYKRIRATGRFGFGFRTPIH